jgi:O-antigen/teichoic acid export membrane protein
MSQKRQLVSNSVSMLVNKLVQGGTSFMLTASIARILGAQALGQYLLAISFYYIFVNISSQGLKTLFTREVALDPAKTSLYLVSGTLLQFVLSIFGYIGMVVVVYLLPYSNDTSFVCYVLGIAIIPFALSNITEAILQAQEKMHLIAVSTAPIYISRVLIMLWLMTQHFGIVYIAGVLVVSELIIFIIQWLLLVYTVKPTWHIDQDFIWNIFRLARTLFAIEGMGIVASRIDVLSLSLLGNDVLLGLYGAVSQLMQPFHLVSRSLILAAFPRMSKAVQLGKEQQRQEAESIMKLLLCMVLPFFVGILVFSREVLILVYNDPSFLQADTILKIFSFTLVPITCSLVLSYVLIANGLERITLLEVAITTTVGGLSSILLVPSYKLMGAAITILIMSLSSFTTFVINMQKHLFAVRPGQVLRLPIFISSVMLGVFIALKQIQMNFVYIVILSIVFYLTLVFLLAIREFGGVDYMWQKISSKK